MRVTLLFLTMVVTGAIYLASPFWAAWSVREAIRTGDTAALDRKVDWPAVRASLKASLKAEQAGAELERAEASGRSQLTLWQRFKTRLGAGMVERFVDSTVTPDGLVRSFAARNQGAGMTPDPADDASLPLARRFAAFVERVDSVAYPAFGRFEVTVRDRQNADRRFTGRMVLEGFEWRLADLTVWTLPASSATVRAASPTLMARN